jgi:hypothetical protein
LLKECLSKPDGQVALPYPYGFRALKNNNISKIALNGVASTVSH